MKKIVSIIMLIAMLCVCLTSCGNSSDHEGIKMAYRAETYEEVMEFIMNLDPNKYEVTYGPYTDWGGLVTVKYREKQSTSTDHMHSWIEKCVEGETVKFCEECGKIEQNTTTESHSHTWDVKKVDGKFISFCTECGKIAEQ